MPEQTQSNNELLGSGSVRQIDPEPSYGDVSRIESIQKLIPKYQGYNPHNLKERLINDQEFFNEFTTDTFNTILTEEQRQLEPEDLAELKNRYARNSYNELVKESYVGQLEKTTLNNRSVQLHKAKKSVPLERYKTLIQNNEEYESLAGFENDEALKTYILNNDEVHESLSKKLYGQFEEELSKSHNTGALFNDITSKAKAYSIFETWGSEGLTQYVNLLQYPQGSDDIAGSFQKREEALQFFQNARDGKDTPEETIQEFLVGNKVTNVPFENEINKAALSNGVAPSLLAGLFKRESAFKADSVSSAGAAGIAQFQPATAREMGLKVPDELYELDVKRIEASKRGDYDEAERIKKQLASLSKKYKNKPEEDERFNRKISIEGSAKLLDKHLKRFDGDTSKALAAYNAGAGVVLDAEKKAEEMGGDWFSHIPKNLKQTVDYVPAVEQNAKEYGVLDITHTPLTARPEIQNQVPEDTNFFTANFYQKEGDGRITEREKKSVYEKFLKRHVPKDYRKFLKTESLQETLENTKEGRVLTASVYKEAAQDNGSFTLNDLMDTLKAKGTYVSEDGRDTWIIDTNDLDERGTIAFNAVRADKAIDKMFEQTNRVGVVKFMPERMDKYRSMQRDVLNTLMLTKEVATRDENGNVSFETQADDGFFAQILNSGITAAYGVVDGLGRYIYEPTVRYGADAYSELFGEEAGQPAQKLSDQLQGFFTTGLAEGMDAETDGIMPATVGEIMPWVQVIASIQSMGAGLIKGGAAALSTATKVKNANDLLRMSSAMKGSSRLAGMAAKLNKAVGNKTGWTNVVGKGSRSIKPWVTAGGTFYVGEQVFEFTRPDDERLINVIPELFGAEPTNDFRMTYLEASDGARLAMNAAASLGTSLFVDTLIGAGRYGVNMMRYMKGKRGFKSFKFDEETGEFAKVDKPEFYLDVMEFGRNLTSDLDKLPIGGIGQYKADGFEFESLADVAKTFVDNVDDVAGYVKKDIEDHVRTLNQSIGSEPLTESAIKQIADEQYDNFLNGLATQMEGLMKQGGEDLPLKFADRLENGLKPVVKEFKPQGEAISPLDVQYYKDQGFNVFEKEGKVYEASPQFWTIDLAQKIRERNLNPTKEDILRREYSKVGIDPKNMTANQAEQAAEISRDVSYILGRHVEVDGNAGYIVDIADDGFVIRTSNGDVKVNNFEDIPEDVLARREVDATVSQRLDRLAKTQESLKNTKGRFSKLSEVEEKVSLRKKEQEKTARLIGDISETPQAQAMVDVTQQPRTVREAIGRNVTYQGRRGILQYDDAGFPVVRTGDNELFELPSLRNLDQSLDEMDIRPYATYDQDVAAIGGNVYNFQKGLDSFEFKGGRPVKAELIDATGKRSQFTNQDIVDELFMARMAGEDLPTQINKGWRETRLGEITPKYEQKLRDYAETYYDVAKTRTRIPFC